MLCVSEIMSSGVWSCPSTATLDQAIEMMASRGCSSIPVVDDNNKPVGIITDRDITMYINLKHQSPWDIRLSQFTKGRHIYCCYEQDDIQDALKKLRERHIHRLPVLDDNDKLVGIVTMNDVIQRAEESDAADLSYKDVVETLKAVSKHYRNT
ncbi:MAG: CBS domain-containing protein [Pseudomonadales bacterium]